MFFSAQVIFQTNPSFQYFRNVGRLRAELDRISSGNSTEPDRCFNVSYPSNNNWSVP